jgi:alpha-tubulin suppressor-like RCC1 family protein
MVAALALFVSTAGPVTASSQRFAKISIGQFHTCGLTSRGVAYCWGYNEYGQLGDGTTGNDSGVNGPQPVIGGLKFKSISAGGFHTCGLTSRGVAYCWGWNRNGGLGDGTTDNASGVNGPQPVIGGLTFSNLVAGDYHTCGLTARGVAYCWGFNEDGELGDGTTSDSGVNGPQPVIGGLRFANLVAGASRSCGLTARGVAYCWGFNLYGGLGNGTTTDSGVNGPQPVIGGLKFKSISSGAAHTCGLTVRRTAYCWGFNEDGELGDGRITNSDVNGPQPVIGGLRFASIQGGGYHTCGLTVRRTAYCWGFNESGQLGDGRITSSRVNGPQPVIGGLRFASIQGGGYHTCGLTVRRTAYCWGFNEDGELGDGTTSDSGVNGPQAVR